MASDNSHIKPIDAESIPMLDNGAFGDAINRALTILFRDILDRPSNAAGKVESRVLKIEICLTPEVDEVDRKLLTGIKLEPKVKGDCPATVGGITDVRFVGSTPSFNQDNPSEFYQRSLLTALREQDEATAKAS